MKRFRVLSQVVAGAILFGAFSASTPVFTSPAKDGASPDGLSAPATIETDGTLDLPFDAGEFTNGWILAAVLQPDGKLLIAGRFSKVHGVARHGIARLNTDGTLDLSFDPGGGTAPGAKGIVLQTDSKIIIFGYFGSFDGTNRFTSIARLNSDGSLDNSFDPGRGISRDGRDDGSGGALSPGTVNSAVLQPDGKIVLVGQFFHIITGPGTSVSRSCVARFNSDGTFDPSYNPGTGAQNFYVDPSSTFVNYAVRQNMGPHSGKIIIAGYFDGFDDHFDIPGLVRLNPDGSLDETFNPGVAADSFSVFGLFVQADDQILIFGRFTSFSGVPRSGIVRLDSSGVVDGGFSTEVFTNYYDVGGVFSVAQQSNGKLIVGGTFHSLGGVVAHNVVRLETNGARDVSYNATGAGPSAVHITAVLVRSSDSKIFLGGYFSTYGNAPRNNMAWANADGSVDNTFTSLSGATDYDSTIYAVAVQPDGKILVGGFFTSFNGTPHYNLVRLNPDSTIDASFDAALGTSGSVRAILYQPDGKIVIGGFFTSVNGVARGRVARINADGTLDTSFDPGTGADSVVYALAQDSVGNIYAGGAISSFNGASLTGIVKLNPNGGVDPAFNPGGGGASSTVFAIAPPDGTGGIVIGGQFTRYNGVNRRTVARLNVTTGALDTSFNSANTSYGLVRVLLPTSDGKYYAAGTEIARLHSNGSRDTTFTSPSTGGYLREALALQNGKLFVGGSRNPVLPALVRLTSTGALDSSFNTGTGVEFSPTNAYPGFPEVRALAIQEDGKLLFGGLFNTYNGTPRIGLARLTGPDPANPTPGLVGNVSTRLPVGTDENVLIEGFIVQGPAGSVKTLLVRAIGPSLASFGIGDALANPTLEIHDSNNATVATNNDWRNTEVGGLITGDQSAEISASGVAPSDDLESAIIANLAPGSYTAVVRGLGNTVGTGLVDAYDISAGSPARLGNVATRGFIQPGDKLMIAGFIVQNGPVRAVVRAIGPSLTALGVSNPLPDTTLQLRNENGVVLLENDDWKTDPAQKQELEGTGLQPTNDLEAAVIMTLPPGQYTAQVRGKGESSGIGVVEAYFLQ